MTLEKFLAGTLTLTALAAAPAPEAKADLFHTNPNAYTIAEDDFNDGVLDGWVDGGGNYIENGALKLQTAVGKENLDLPPVYEIQFDMRSPDTQNLWVYGNYDITPEKARGLFWVYRIGHEGNDFVRNLGFYGYNQQVDHPLTGSWNNYAIVNDNSNFEFYANDQLLWEVSLTDQFNGDSVQLLTEMGHEIDNFKVWTIPEPSPATALAALGATALASRRKRSA